MKKKIIKKDSEKELETIKKKMNLIEQEIGNNLSFVKNYGNDLKSGLRQINEIFNKIVEGKESKDKKKYHGRKKRDTKKSSGN